MAIRPRVVVVGSGFGGLAVVDALAGHPVDITVIDRDNYHGFWPLLYQVATAALGSDAVAAPIRGIHSSKRNVEVRLGTVKGVDLDCRTVCLESGVSVSYDYLVLAPGSSSADFGIPGVRDHAFSMKTLPDAVRLRNHVLTSFEKVDAAGDDGAKLSDGALTFVLVGGGATGVEMAGALAELISHNLAADFHHLDVSKARVVLVEMTDRLLPGFSARSQQAAEDTLRAKGVELRMGTSLESVSEDGVILAGGEEIAAATVVWTAGVKANPLAETLPGEKARGGRVPVEADLSLPGRPEVFVVGDLAAASDHKGALLPQVAQVAIQGGEHAGKSIIRRMSGRKTRAFKYHSHGAMATIGRRSAVAELPGGIVLTGSLGWFAWLAVHLMFLVGFRNRVVVMVNWAWNYITWDRATRVILDSGDRTPTGESRP